jgi:O-6-methylguanine DNA methyltransferase
VKNSLLRLPAKIADFPHIAVQFNQEGCTLRLPAVPGFYCENPPVDSRDTILQFLKAYSQGLSFRFPIPSASPFYEQVWRALSEIPFGETISYRDLACKIGRPEASRAVGQACNRNPMPLLIPCHRVIRSNGSIGGFALDLEIKKRLLAFEKDQGGTDRSAYIQTKN